MKRYSQINHNNGTIIMRVFILLILECILLSALIAQGHSENHNSQQVKLTLRFSNVPLVRILDAIEEQSEFFFLYNEKLINIERRVNIDMLNADISKILDFLFTGTDVVYTLVDQKIILAPVDLSDVKEKMKITGKVTDEKGNPLPGVNIVEKGTLNGTITDLDGKYILSVNSEKTTLVFSFIGFLTDEVKTNGNTSMDVSLSEDIMSLDEVVVTALGIKREEKALGYAVQKLSGDGIQTVKGVNVSTSLTGKVSGLLVQNSTEFATIDSVHIRGETPLVVIDGIPYGNLALEDIPPDDIEEISVLKGATASALYGYRGQSGAILITTKRGQMHKGTRLTINSGSMFTVGFLAIPEMQSTYGRLIDKTTNTYVTYGKGSWGPPMEGQLINQWDPISKTFRLLPYLPIGKDNFRNFLEQGYVLNNNISFVQQGENGSFRTSVTWMDNKGIYPNSNLNKITYMAGGKIKWDKFTIESNMTYNKRMSPNIGFSEYKGYDPMYSLLVWSSPDWDVRQYKDYWLVPNEKQNSSYTADNNNPYFDRYERLHSINRDIFSGLLNMGYSFTPRIKLILRSGFDIYSEHQTIRISEGSFHGGGTSTVLRNGRQVWGEPYLGSFNVGLGKGYSINNDLLFMANKTLGHFHLDGLAGGTIFYTHSQGIQAFTQDGLIIPAFYSLKASVSPVDVRSETQKQQVNSIYGRLVVSWKNLIFWEGTLRTDWSSTFFGNSTVQITRYYSYPSLSVSFVMSELIRDADWLSLWKFRTSWTSAKTPASPYAINQVYNVTQSAWGDLSSASLPGSIRATNVNPEASSTWEIGSATRLFKNRASFDVAYFRKRMYNFLRAAEISEITGYESNYINIAEEITRKGIEATTEFIALSTRNWDWKLALNGSKYARYYTKIDPIFSLNSPWVKVGKRADYYLLRDFQKDQDGNIIHNAGLPLYSPYYSLFGYRDPDWVWGIGSSLSYKNFTFSISFDGRIGGMAKTVTEIYMWRTGNHPESVVPERYLDATESGGHYVGQGVKVVSGTVTYDTYGNITSDTRVFASNDVPVLYQSYLDRIHTNSAWGSPPSPLDVYSTTFIKVREISFTYHLPLPLITKFNAQKASVSIIGQNLFLWAKDFRYSDPDSGVEDLSDPSVRYLGLNFQITF